VDPLDRAIASLAEEVFGVEGPGLNDNFLDLGCDSLKATAFLRRVEQRLGHVIAVEVFLRKPTIAGVAEAIRAGGHVAPSECLIAIRPGGTRPPLFCLPGLDGEAGWFQLAQLLGPEQPVYGLQAQGLDGTREPHGTLREMAAHYASAIQRVRPEQPAYLFGYSISGLLVQECARQLEQSGRSLGPLILVDTLDLGQYRRGWQFLRKVNSRLGRYFRRPRASSVQPGAEMPCRDALRAAIRHATGNHQPKPYRGRAIFFQPSDSGFLFPQTRYAPWRELISGGLEVRTVPGDHLSMVEFPHIEELARQLREALGPASTH
jgi:thioesterase domain-containing protein